jgi:zinc protease
MNTRTRKTIAIAAVAWVLILFFPFAAVAADNVARATLPNGLRVVIVPNALAPVVTTEVTYLVGAVEAPDGFPGMAHALEHMMFRGNPGLSADQFSAISAALGGHSNAGTSQTTTGYHRTVPSDALDIALHMEAIRMRGVLCRERDWAKERGAIDQEVARDLSDPQYTFYIRLLKEMYAGTPYDHTALGTRPSFQKTTGAMLRKFHRDWYAPNNAILVIAGDVEPEKALGEVKRLFGPIRSRTLPPRPKIEIRPLRAARIEMETDLPFGQAVVAYRLPGYESPDFAAGTILADVLDSRRGDLYALVPQGKALSVSFNADALPKAAFGYAVASFPKGGDGNALVSRLKEIVAAYGTKGIPADLVEAAKRHEIAEAGFMKNSIAGLASAWSQALAVEGRNSPEDDIEAIRNVTVDDVNRVAMQYLTNETAITAILTPHESGKPVSSKGFGGSETFAPQRTKKVKIPAWAKKAVETPSAPVSRIRPSDTMLANGIRLIVQPESVSPTITLIGRVRNNPNLETPEGKEGVDRVLNALFPYGTKTYDRLEFQKELDDIGAEASAGAAFSLRVLAENFDRGVRLLAENVLHPALPEDSFPVVRDQVADSVEGEIRTPSYLSQRALHFGLFPKTDPSLRQATRETVASLSLRDVRSYHEKVFRPDLTTIVVVGQITPEQARETIERYFGEWKASGPKPGTDLPSVPPNKPSTAEVPNAIRMQVNATFAETVGLTRFAPDYYTLQVGTHVLAGAFYATRLYRDLREETGLVYFVHAQLSAGRTRSVFSVNFGCDPMNVSKARDLVVRNLKAMKESPVTPAELRQAKILLLRQIPLSESSTDRIAQMLAYLATEGLPLEESVRAANRYMEITADEVREAFAMWIRPGDFVQVTEGPTPK